MHKMGHKSAAPHPSYHLNSDSAPIRGKVSSPPDSEKSSHTPGGRRGPHARMTSALSLEEAVTAVCKLNMTNRFPASPLGRRDERRRRGRSPQARPLLKCEERVRGEQPDRQQCVLKILPNDLNKTQQTGQC